MKNIFVHQNSPLRKAIPFIQKTRQWAFKYNARVGERLVVSGGRIQFMDAELNFPEDIGMTYSTPLLWNGPYAYEEVTSRTIAQLISRSRSFFDIGSNIGIYSVYAGVKFPLVRTFAFEPVPVIWEKNRAFHRANGLPETTVHNLAMSDRVGNQRLIMPIYTTGIEEEQTATLCENSWQASEAKTEGFEIQCTTLDAFTGEHSVPEGACCLKIDVENFEAAVLSGGKMFINQRRPWIVCEILPGQKIDRATGARTNDNIEVVKLIQELNYAPLAITSEGIFRMTPDDFELPRGFKDFVLAPRERISASNSYFSTDALEELLSKAL